MEGSLYLLPIRTAAWQRKTSQPTTQEASGAGKVPEGRVKSPGRRGGPRSSSTPLGPRTLRSRRGGQGQVARVSRTGRHQGLRLIHRREAGSGHLYGVAARGEAV